MTAAVHSAAAIRAAAAADAAACKSRRAAIRADVARVASVRAISLSLRGPVSWTQRPLLRGAVLGLDPSDESGRISLISGSITRLLRWQQLRADLILDLAGELLVLLQEDPDVILALANPGALVAVPGA